MGCGGTSTIFDGKPWAEMCVKYSIFLDDLRVEKNLHFKKPPKWDNNLQTCMMFHQDLIGPPKAKMWANSMDGATFRSALLIKMLEVLQVAGLEIPGNPGSESLHKNRQVAIVPVTSPLRISPGVSKLDQPQHGSAIASLRPLFYVF